MTAALPLGMAGVWSVVYHSIVVRWHALSEDSKAQFIQTSFKVPRRRTLEQEQVEIRLGERIRQCRVVA
jgi:hypothetical protein